MTRSLAALACFTALFVSPAKSEAGPWMYEDSFYSPSWGGYGWGTGYRGYTTGYAPFYTGYVTSYAPWSYGGACCSPCGTSCCNPCGTSCCSPCGSACGTSCDPGCGSCPGGNCPGGNCATGAGTTPVESNPSDAGTSGTPTYVPPTSNDNRTPPADQFQPAGTSPPPRNRDGQGTGTKTPSAGGFDTPTTGGTTADPNSSAPAPDFKMNPAEPKPGYFDRKDDQSRENGATTPKLNPIEPGEKVAFKTPARFTRTRLQPMFELPVIVKAPPSTRPEATPPASAVASK
jgi:hypothetical protein